MSEYCEHKSLAEALAAFQGEAPVLYKNEEAGSGSFKYKYVDLKAVVAAIQEPMCTHGLSFSGFPCLTSDGKPGLRYTLRHVSGDTETEVMPLMLSKADAQALGSAITYARRYALCAALNLVADADDDGQAAKEAAERAARANNGSEPEFATAQDVAHITQAAKGLSAQKIRLAFVSVGLQPPAAEVQPEHWFDRIPRPKAQLLAEALAGVQR